MIRDVVTSGPLSAPAWNVLIVRYRDGGSQGAARSIARGWWHPPGADDRAAAEGCGAYCQPYSMRWRCENSSGEHVGQPVQAVAHSPHGSARRSGPVGASTSRVFAELVLKSEARARSAWRRPPGAYGSSGWSGHSSACSRLRRPKRSPSQPGLRRRTASSRRGDRGETRAIAELLAAQRALQRSSEAGASGRGMEACDA